MGRGGHKANVLLKSTEGGRRGDTYFALHLVMGAFDKVDNLSTYYKMCIMNRIVLLAGQTFHKVKPRDKPFPRFVSQEGH